ncbi:type IV pilus assembly protein PilM [uncultured Umboniibacter sp.]|uniref:type IV pilus assembly protein PilM n=1 Tax=uncultured Umboniibacter sp. TaxID=1798917 RepID=UPI0026159087|nr:type IV pilus assembly protein PilM [uncultured Umboniibacter sp.]
MSLKGLFAKPQRRLLGLDVSSTAVKLLELSKSGDKYRIEAYGVLGIPEGAVVDRTIKDPEAVSAVIRKLVSRTGTKLKGAAVAVTGSSVIIKRLQMPAELSESDLETRIIMDAEQYITFPIEEVSLDFEVLGPSQTEGQLDVLLVACRSENVEMLADVVSAAGLVPEVVDVEVFALARAFSFVAPQLEADKDSAIALFDIGATATNITVIQGGATGVPREVNFGGHLLTDQIMQRYGLSLEEAGQAKRLGGLPDDYQSEVLAPWIEDAVDQLQSNLRNYVSAAAIDEVDYVVLAGGGAAIPGLAEAFEARTGIQSFVADPFARVNFAKRINKRALQSDAQAMTVATGLAMWSFIDGKH